MATPATKFGGSVRGTIAVLNDKSSETPSKTRQSMLVQGPGGALTHDTSANVTIQVPELVAELVKAKITLKHAFGGSSLPYDGLQTLSKGLGTSGVDCPQAVYRVGRHLCMLDIESLKEKFFQRPSNVVNVLHFTTSPNNRHMSVCETVRQFPDDKGHAQISVYSLVIRADDDDDKVARLARTLVQPTKSGEFVYSVFSPDNKHIFALLSDPSVSTNGEKQILQWAWDSGKLVRSFSVSQNVNRLHCIQSSNNSFFLTCSGINHLKGWFLGPDGNMQSIPLVPSGGVRECGFAKEKDISFADHAWLPSSGDLVHKLVALGGPAEIPTEVMNLPASMQAIKSWIMIYEGLDTPVDNASKGKGGGKGNDKQAPVTMDLRQTLVVAGTLNAIIPTIKGFVAVGQAGLVIFFERSDDRREGYVQTKRMIIGDGHFISGDMVRPSEDRLLLLQKDGKMLNLPVDFDSLSTSALTAVASPPVTTVTNNDSSTSTTSGAINPYESVSNSFGATVIASGFHTQQILCADMATERPILATVSVDQTARIWNFETQTCELLHQFKNDEPLAVAVHPSGFLLLISFKDRVRSYNILSDKLRPYRETILKNSKELRFSRGGHLFAAASSVNISVFSTSTFTQVALLQGHTMTVRKLAWADGDQVLFSAGQDGNVFGWPVNGEGRMEVVANPRGSAIQSMIVDSESTLYPKVRLDDEENAGGSASGPSTASNAVGTVVGEGVIETADVMEKYAPHTLIMATLDGNIKIPEWRWDMVSERMTLEPSYLWGPGGGVYVTALHQSKDRSMVFAGTSIGTIRAYAWPPVGKGKMGVYMELQAHTNSVVCIRESGIGNAIISVAEDGTIFVFSLDRHGSGGNSLSSSSMHDFESYSTSYNSDVILQSQEDLEEHLQAVINLQKALVDAQAKFSMAASQREIEFNDQLRASNEHSESILQSERLRNERQRSELEKKLKELTLHSEARELENAKVKAEIENRYEHKVADQMDRYDRLSEEMELLRQKCEGLLRQERESFTKQINDLRNETRLREKKLRAENRRVAEDRIADEGAFKEILDQQEDEYEDELKQLIVAAEAELTSEREIISKMRTLVQTKNTKNDQLKKKLVEVSQASKARLLLLQSERQEKAKLLERIEYYKQNLKEREDVIAEKEKMIIELRSTTRTLENFRFVLDHRLQQLSAERGPISSHIEGLERHISTMYEEFVEDYDYKQTTAMALDQSKLKIHLLTQEVGKLKEENNKKETFLANFKREVGNIISSNATGKDLEDAVRVLYRKFVRGETGADGGVRIGVHAKEKLDELMKGDDDPGSPSGKGGGGATGAKGKNGGGMTASFVREVEEALIDTAKEADRQKHFMERSAAQLKRRLEMTKRESDRLSRNRLTDNSNLLYECNNLRRENKTLERKLEVANRELLEMAETRALLASMKHGGTGALDGGPLVGGPLTEGTAVLDGAVSGNKAFPEMDDSRPTVDLDINQQVQENGQEGDQTQQQQQPTPWHINNSLARNNSTGGLLGRNNRSKASSLAPSATMPILVRIPAENDTRSIGSIRTLQGQGVPVTSNILHARIPDMSQKMKQNPTYYERQIERLTKEITSLEIQLDDAFREKEVTRLEMDRIRNILIRITNEKKMNVGARGGGKKAVVGEGSSTEWIDENMSHSLTSADMAQALSDADKAALSLQPNSKSSPIASKPRSSQGGKNKKDSALPVIADA